MSENKSLFRSPWLITKQAAMVIYEENVLISSPKPKANDPETL